ncbi:MAG: hypothetical protein GXY85_00890 [Candidatus Brocadiaceae bacterium]|nr:hypothetical protein [Candidatus Brocadiaceae bacterium]
MLSALICFIAASAAAAATPPVECRRVAWGAESGLLVSVDAGTVVLLQDGRRTSHPLDAFRDLVLAPVSEPPLPPPLTVWTAGGHRLAVRRVRTEPAPGGALTLLGYGWRAEGMPLGSLRGLATRAALQAPAEDRRAFEAAMADPPTGHDLLRAERGPHGQVLACTVEALGEDGVELTIGGGRRRSLGWDAVGWIVLGPVGDRAPAPVHRVLLADGTAVPLDAFELRGGRLSGLGAGARWTIEAARLARVRVASERHRCLSDLQPARVATTPLLDVVWPPRFDASVAGPPLRMGGEAFSTGIGMHVRTEMEFAPDGDYTHLCALVGVDDAAGASGAVVFRVEADGRAVFRSDALHGGDAPIAVTADIAGARRVTLIAESADPTALSGQFADWAEARFVRAP